VATMTRRAGGDAPRGVSHDRRDGDRVTWFGSAGVGGTGGLARRLPAMARSVGRVLGQPAGGAALGGPGQPCVRDHLGELFAAELAEPALSDQH
jgi:hypothetical protein